MDLNETEDLLRLHHATGESVPAASKPLQNVGGDPGNNASTPSTFQRLFWLATVILLFATGLSYFAFLLIGILLGIIYTLWHLRRQATTVQPNRVKCIASHPDDPNAIALSFISGHISLWRKSETPMKSFSDGANDKEWKSILTRHISSEGVRSCRFLSSGKVVTACDDGRIRVYDDKDGRQLYNFAAHDDFVRSLAVHPSRSQVLSGSDDRTVKLWDAEFNWACMRTYFGHSHYVMDVRFNPHKPQEFATASLDRVVFLWDLDSSEAMRVLEGHEQGVNCVAYCTQNQSVLASGSDDQTIIIWNHQTAERLHTLRGHTDNVTALLYHNEHPYLFSTSEDATVRLWKVPMSDKEAYQPLLEHKLSSRGWALCSFPAGFCVGHDFGCLPLEVSSSDEDGDAIQLFEHTGFPQEKKE